MLNGLYKVEYGVKLATLQQVVDEMGITVSGSDKQALTTAWGPGIAGKNILDVPTLYYVNAARTLRA